MSQMAADRTTAPWYLGATTTVALPWLIRLRWTTAILQIGVAAIAWALPQFDLPLRRVAPLLLATALMNTSIAGLWVQRKPVPHLAAALDAVLQIVLLTGLLELSGGPFNPFVVIYGVQVALVWLTLGMFWGLTAAGTAAIAFGVLVSWHLTELVPGHHRLNDFPTHLFTMWTAIAVTGELAAYFVVQASNAIARREHELDELRARAARTDRLVALTTLGAGAAHELSTPLATIALASRELERAALARQSATDLVEDAQLIRREVDRCQAILDQMSGRAVGASVDAPETLDIPQLLEDIRAQLAPDDARRLQVKAPPSLTAVSLPRAGLRQALLSLLKNAFDAGSGTPVVVEVLQDEARLRLRVRDSGRGMPPDVLERAGEPFFTTKDPGRGMGMGLFLTRVFAERFGGTLSLRSDRGTIATLELPTGAAR
jgi:two-component system sensor histidine kinase RegB